MGTSANVSHTVVVVDRNPEDYGRWARFARQQGMRFYYMHSGGEALQVRREGAVSLWMINIDLPDMSGFELVARLEPRRHGSDVFLVADAYRADDEVRTLSLGVTLYLCKPARAAWLRHWRPVSALEMEERGSCRVPPGCNGSKNL